MVSSCVAYKCTNLFDGRKKIPFHRFPFTRPDILKLWVEAVGRETNWFPSRTSKLCGDHFLPNDYQHRPGCINKLLKPNAVPSIFSSSQDLAKNPVLTRLQDIANTGKNNEALEADSTDCDLDVPSSSTPLQINNYEAMQADTSNSGLNLLSKSAQLQNEQETQTVIEYKDHIDVLMRKVKTLQKKLRRKNLQISTMKRLIICLHSGKKMKRQF